MTAIGAVSLALVVLTAGAAAPSSRSPFELQVAPPAMVEGEGATVTVVTRHPVDPKAAGERADLYVVSVFGLGASFLTPAGAWSRDPVPIRVRRALGDAAPIVVEWPQPTAGWTLLALLTVREGADPLARAGWLHRPAEAWVRIDDAPREIDTRDVLVLAGLAAVTLGGVLVLMRYPRGL